MKVTALALNEAIPALNALANTKLPAKVAYRIGKAMNAISSHQKAVEDFRINLLNKMATLSADRTKYEFDPLEKEAEFNQIFNEEKQREVDIELPIFTLDQLGDIKIEPVVLSILAKIGMLVELTAVPDIPEKNAEKV